MAAWDFFLIVGQSNAVGVGLWDNPEPPFHRVAMFGNDYNWKEAYEPVDDRTNQVDLISQDGAGVVPGVGHNCHSCWLRAAKQICLSRPQAKICLIPCPKGSTVFQTDVNEDVSWELPAFLDDRATLWGSAYYRAKVAATRGAAIKAIVFIGQESSTESSFGGENLLATYYQDFIRWANNWRNYLQADVPIIAGQLGPSYHGGDATPAGPSDYDNTNLWLNFHVARNYMRLTEQVLSNFKLVTCFDRALNAADPVHLNRAGQDVLGDRFGLAIRQLVYGESVNGTGPRPIECVRGSSTQFYAVFDKAIADGSGSDWDGQLRIYDGNTHIAISSTALATGYQTNDSILITTATGITGKASITYGQTRRNTALTDYIMDSDGIPSPGFTITEP